MRGCEQRCAMGVHHTGGFMSEAGGPNRCRGFVHVMCYVRNVLCFRPVAAPFLRNKTPTRNVCCRLMRSLDRKTVPCGCVCAWPPEQILTDVLKPVFMITRALGFDCILDCQKRQRCCSCLQTSMMCQAQVCAAVFDKRKTIPHSLVLRPRGAYSAREDR